MEPTKYPNSLLKPVVSSKLSQNVDNSTNYLSDSITQLQPGIKQSEYPKKKVEKNRIEFEIRSPTPILDAISTIAGANLKDAVIQSFTIEPLPVTEYKTSLSIGKDFGPDDINVQLVDDLNDPKKPKKLTINCFKIESIPTNDLKETKNYVKKELNRDITLPINAEISTLESYLENGNLYFKCLLKNDVSTMIKTSYPDPTPIRSTPVKEYSKSIDDLRHAESSKKKQITRHDSCQVYENPLYNNNSISKNVHIDQKKSFGDTGKIIAKVVKIVFIYYWLVTLVYIGTRITVVRRKYETDKINKQKNRFFLF